MRRQPFITIVIAALLVLAGCTAGSPGASGAEAGNGTDSTIQVAGSGSAEAEPNQAVVDVEVVATAPDAATARQRLARNTTRMRDALEAIGVGDDQITTRRYDLGRDYRPPRREGEEPRVRYRASHAFEITLSDTERVGTVIDTAVENGATAVHDVEFTLSTELRRELEADARAAAMADARSKARSLAATENLTVTGVEVIRTGAGSPRPVAEMAAATPTAAAGDGAASDVESGPVTVTTTVRVVYRAAPEGEDGGAAPE
jgi:uncharacterized protein YggE